MSVELIIDNEYEFFDNICSLEPTKFDLGLKSYVYHDRTLADILVDTISISKAIEHAIICKSEFNGKPLYNALEDKINKLPAKGTDEYIEELQSIAIDVVNNIEWVRITFRDNEKIKTFIEQNEYLHTKKIILPEYLTILDYEKAESLLKEYNFIKDNIYVLMDNNSGYVKIEDAYKAIKKVREIALEAINLNMSPAEQTMFIYDQIRKRTYKEENENEDKNISRDLVNVLNDDSDSIVCLGYSNIFNAILKYLKIKNEIVVLKHKDDDLGHTRNVVYLKDDKYNIDGIYYFDLAFDSNKQSDKYLSNYLNFAKTRKEIDDLDNNSYIDDKNTYYADNMITEAIQIIDSGDYELLEKNDMVKSLNYLAELLYDQILVSRMNLVPYSPYYGQFDEDEVKYVLRDINKKINNPISAETYLEILKNVHEKENKQELNAEENLYETFIRSKWKFKKHHYTIRELALKNVLDDNHYRGNKDEAYYDFIAYVSHNTNDDKYEKTMNSIIKNRK